jgi:hypothetical protein
MPTRLLTHALILTSLLAVAGTGCVHQDASGASRTADVTEVYSIAITAATPSALPKCTSALEGAVAYVTSAINAVQVCQHRLADHPLQ